MDLVYSVPYASVGIGNIEFMSLNSNETRLYASRWVQSYPDSELIRIDLDKPGRPVTVVASPGSGSPYTDANMPAVLFSTESGDRVVFTDRIAGLDHCYLLRVVQANQDGTVVLENNFIRYGRYSTTLDGHILTTGYKPPNKRGRCDETGMINRIDPDSGIETPLVRGLNADGR
jgi:hypothetical protein